MKPSKRLLCLWLAASALSLPARAETVVCPDLAQAVQVGACPSEDDLRVTFAGYCSDNARMYDKPDRQLCTDFELYRSVKDIALWETADGRFSGYVRCEPGKSGLSGAVPNRVRIDRQGSVTRMSCGYSTGVSFTYRSKTVCRADAAACATDPAACKASCE